jgi:hypothetical protein
VSESGRNHTFKRKSEAVYSTICSNAKNSKLYARPELSSCFAAPGRGLRNCDVAEITLPLANKVAMTLRRAITLPCKFPMATWSSTICTRMFGDYIEGLRITAAVSPCPQDLHPLSLIFDLNKISNINRCYCCDWNLGLECNAGSSC